MVERQFVSVEENDIYVSTMLKGNEVIEQALKEWKENQEDLSGGIHLFQSIFERDTACGGLIVSVQNRDIPTGADHLAFFNGDKPLTLNRAEGESGKGYLLVFTSRDRFCACKDSSGVVMFIRELLYLLPDVQGVDGILFNLGYEEVLLDNKSTRMLCNFIKYGESKV